MMNEFNEYVRDCFSQAGDIVIKSMMGGYLVYFKGKLIGDVCGDELFLKRTPTSDFKNIKYFGDNSYFYTLIAKVSSNYFSNKSSIKITLENTLLYSFFFNSKVVINVLRITTFGDTIF